MPKQKHKNIFELWEALLVLCGLLIGIMIFCMHSAEKHKKEVMEAAFVENKIYVQQPVIAKQTSFWKVYDVILAQRADTNGNGAVSVQEKEEFDKQFFGDRNLVVDPVTKTVTKTDGSAVDLNALICHINNFYLDKPWIKPVCPDL